MELLTQQLVAIDAWIAARHRRTSTRDTSLRSGQARLLLSRATQVLDREHDALVARTHQQLLQHGDGPGVGGRPRALLVERSSGSLDKIAVALADMGVAVVGRLLNGADGIGFGIAEQPDLALVDETLEMVSGVRVVRELGLFAPHTLVAVRTESIDRIGSLLDAGARIVFTRRCTPRDVAQEIVQLVR